MREIFLSSRCPCGADGVPRDRPYCEACLDRLAAAVTDTLRGDRDAE